MDKKKVLFLDQNLDGGGAERVLCTIMRSLDMTAFKVDLVVIGKLGGLKHLVPDYVSVYELGIDSTRKALFSFIKIVFMIRPDIVFTTLTRTTVLSVVSRLICPKFKLIARYPNMPSWEVKGGYVNGWRLFLTRNIYRYVDLTIAQSHEMKNELINFYHIPDTKIKTIFNPIDVSYVDDSAHESKNPFSTHEINILASGRLLPQKGFDLLIKAFSIITKDNDKFHLHILGKDINDGKQVLLSLVKSLKLEEKVTFHGFIENPYPFYKHCDLFVLSSRWEGFPNVLLECLYLKTPVVATRCVPIVDKLISHGINGFVIESENIDELSVSILNGLKLLPKEFVYENSIDLFQDLFLLKE